MTIFSAFYSPQLGIGEKHSPSGDDFCMLTVWKQSNIESQHIRYEVSCSVDRERLMQGEMVERDRELMRELYKAKKLEIIRGHISRDHVYLFVSIPSHISYASLFNI